jgi:hypothetical protein
VLVETQEKHHVSPVVIMNTNFMPAKKIRSARAIQGNLAIVKAKSTAFSGQYFFIHRIR